MDHHKLFPTKSLQSQNPPNTTNPSSNIKVSESLGSRVVIFGVLTHDSKGSESLGSRVVIFGVLTHDSKVQNPFAVEWLYLEFSLMTQKVQNP